MTHVALGTAQLGLPCYGLANVTGRPSDREAEAMLDRYCGARGLPGELVVDTAAAYGDAEARLGAYGLPSWAEVVTKVAVNAFDDPGRRAAADVLDCLVADVELSRRRLGRWPDVVLLHSARYAFDDQVLGGLVDLRERVDGLERAEVGVSCYEPAEVDAVVAWARRWPRVPVAVEVPYSVVDRRCEAAMARARARGLRVFARSPFCQGLLLLPADRYPERLIGHRTLAAWRRAVGDDPLGAAVAYAVGCPYADVVVIGAETAAQVADDVALGAGFTEQAMALVDLRRRLDAAVPAEDAVVLPSLWTPRAALGASAAGTLTPDERAAADFEA